VCRILHMVICTIKHVIYWHIIYIISVLIKSNTGNSTRAAYAFKAV